MTIDRTHDTYHNTANGRIKDRTPSPSERVDNYRRSLSKSDTPVQFKVRQFSASPGTRSDPEQRPTPKSRGLNVFAVSPLGARNMQRTQSNESNTSQTSASTRRRSSMMSNTQLPLLPESEADSNTSRSSPTPNYDIPLPSNEQLLQMSIDEQLRILALKEMAIVQRKEQIQNLHKKLRSEEAASNTANKSNRQRTNSNPRDQAIESIKAKRRSSSGATQQLESSPVEDNKRSSKIWSGLTKPLNMLQQFDTMLQNEFEKSLVLDKERQQQQEQQTRHPEQHIQQQHLQRQSARDPNRVSYQSRSSEDSMNSNSAITSPLQSGTSQTLSEYRNNQDRHSDDMIHTVSASIWSFVNDVKENVLASLNEEDTNGSNDFGVDDQIIDLSMYKR
ncbi:TDA11 [Candida metapsilosis]|uniref:TDA11 n=1 Tax=Candida metapsilosis TaxID=273372 RepID=A0A8H7ZEB2_9ASCO|nr:TDA11 [Candida metapsilosis]